MKTNKIILATLMCAALAACLLGCEKQKEDHTNNTEVTETITQETEHIVEETKPEQAAESFADELWIENYEKVKNSKDYSIAYIMSVKDQNTGMEMPLSSMKQTIDNNGTEYVNSTMEGTVIESISTKDVNQQYHVFMKAGDEPWIENERFNDMQLTSMMSGQYTLQNVSIMDMIKNDEEIRQRFKQAEDGTILEKDCLVMEGTITLEEISKIYPALEMEGDTEGSVHFKLYYDKESKELIVEKAEMDVPEFEEQLLIYTYTYTPIEEIKIPDSVKENEMFKNVQYDQNAIRITCGDNTQNTIDLKTEKEFLYQSYLNAAIVQDKEKFYAYVAGYSEDSNTETMLNQNIGNLNQIEKLNKNGYDSNLYEIYGNKDDNFNSSVEGYLITCRKANSNIGIVMVGKEKEAMLEAFEGIEIITETTSETEDLFFNNSTENATSFYHMAIPGEKTSPLSVEEYTEKYSNMQNINSYDVIIKNSLRAKIDNGYTKDSEILRFGKDSEGKTFSMHMSEYDPQSIRVKLSCMNKNQEDNYYEIYDINDEKEEWMKESNTVLPYGRADFVSELMATPTKKMAQDSFDFTLNKQTVKFNNQDCYVLNGKLPLSCTRVAFLKSVIEDSGLSYIKNDENSLVDVNIYFNAATNEYVGEKRVLDDDHNVITAIISYQGLNEINVPDGIEGLSLSENYSDKMINLNYVYVGEESNSQGKIETTKYHFDKNPLFNNYAIKDENGIILGYIETNENAMDRMYGVEVKIGDEPEIETFNQKWNYKSGKIERKRTPDESEDDSAPTAGYCAIYTNGTNKIIVSAKNHDSMINIINDLEIQ